MTASEAREAAAQCREDARRMDGYVTEGPWKERAARMRLCAVALDAYADGIDRPETRGMLETADVFAKAAANHVPAVGSAPAIVAFYELERSQYALAATALRRCAAAEFLPTSSDTNRLHRIRARLLDLVPLDGTMSLADDVQRLDRALADAAAVEREACAAMIEAAAKKNAAAAESVRTPGEEPWWKTRADALQMAANAIRARGAK